MHEPSLGEAIQARADTTFPSATQPTMYFVGVTTGRSSIMKVFPVWARRLGVDARIVGIDCRVHDDPQVYRNVVRHVASNPRALGALVTTHKIDLLAAARDMFDRLDPYAELMGEVSCISKDDGLLVGHAKDPVTSGLGLQAILPDRYWADTGAEMFVIGAGGSSIALTSYVMETSPPDNRPSRIVVSNRSRPRLSAIEKIHARINTGIPVEYHHCPRTPDNDRIVERLEPASLVVNATGLGKDAPGSPLSGNARFPDRAIVWDFN